MAFIPTDSNLAPKVITTQKDLKIFAMGDLHMASNTSLRPSGCKDERGNDVLQTVQQEKMEKNLNLATKELVLKEGTMDAVYFLGDMIEGQNIKAFGADIGNVNADVQIEWAMIALRPLLNILKPKYIFGVTGSEYHTGHSADRMLLRRIAIEYPNITVYYGTTLTFQLGDKLWFLAHRFVEGVSIGASLERYWREMHVKHYNRGRTPDAVMYGHIHQARNPYQIMTGENPVYVGICPCQKYPDEFCTLGSSKGVPRWDIGFMFMEQNGVYLSGKYVCTYEYWKEEQLTKIKRKRKIEV
jgi:hypothetical protein